LPASCAAIEVVPPTVPMDSVKICADKTEGIIRNSTTPRIRSNIGVSFIVLFLQKEVLIIDNGFGFKQTFKEITTNLEIKLGNTIQTTLLNP